MQNYLERIAEAEERSRALEAELADPEVAVIVSVPFATAVTSPPDDTVAIVVSDDAQVTVAPDMVAPPASFTVAARVTRSEERLGGKKCRTRWSTFD